MYKVIWDDETRGVLFVKETPAVSTEIIPPRPVFFEELDLLQFNRSWIYPKTEEPLLWAIDRRYYYQGRWVAEARGGNLFESPVITLTEEGRNLTLAPVLTPLMLAKNQEALRTLECEAIDFVEDTYKKYRKKKHSHFVVSFSGGKDSQVVLDIVSRVIPPDEYIVIFADTTMEIPPTYQAFKEAEKHYTERYPGLKFHRAQHWQHSHALWRKFGPPSRILRWCCTVYKTAPVIKLVRELYPGQKQPKLVIFEGIRSEESINRESYNRISISTKHLSQMNVEIIKEWNTPEVFLYLFHRNIQLNEGYRYGLNRVGCGICPFSSNWSEFIINNVFPNIAKEYVNIIQDYVTASGIKDEDKREEYIAQGQWKKRSGGKGIEINSSIDFLKEKPILDVILSNHQENFLEWIKIVGDVISKTFGNKTIGEIRIDNEIFNFEVVNREESGQCKIKIQDVWKDVLLLNKIKKILYKTTYCTHCGACEVECPTGALRVIPKVQLSSDLCTHCAHCVNFVEKGCLMTKSIAISSGERNIMGNTISGFSKYETFGMKEEWVIAFFNGLERWFSETNLGRNQVRGMVAWLKDAELLEKKQSITTKLCKILKELLSKNELLVWEILWINLAYNSTLINWYVSQVNWGKIYSSTDLKDMVQAQYNDTPKRTISNGINSLIKTFETSPLGKKLKLGIITEEKGNDRYIEKKGTDDIHAIAIAYSLYKYAQKRGSYAFTVSEFYKEEQTEGPYRLFGISKERFEHTLRWLQENRAEIVRVDIVADLENIHLRDDLTCETILTMVNE